MIVGEPHRHYIESADRTRITAQATDLVGASSQNDMYLWMARYVFKDNTAEPNAVGSQCCEIAR